MKVILLTSDYYLSANIAIQSFLSQKDVKNKNIEVVGIIVASTFCFDERSQRSAKKLIARSGYFFFFRHVFLNIWQTIWLKMVRLFFPRKFRETFEIAELAEMNGVPYKNVDDVNSTESQDWMKKQNPDYLVSCLLLQIVKQPVLDIPQLGAINFHPALLHQHRGIHAAFWALFHNRKRSGATVHFMTAEVDEGEIVLTKTFRIYPSDSVFCVNKRSAILGGRLLVRSLLKLQKGKRPYILTKLSSIFSSPYVHNLRRFYQQGKSLVKWKDICHW